jgi:homoserine O-acetyltransferase
MDAQIPERRDMPRPSGAWRPGDPVGQRQFATVVEGRRFHLEGGGKLSEIVTAFETWGELNDDASNAVLVCHALTGDSHAHGRAEDGHPAPGWWDGLIGPGRALDTDRYFVVCPNVLGGCQGTTGPASDDPATGRPYGSSFPVVTIRDMVRVQALLADGIGIDRWQAVVGGSMGGMQCLEWAAMFPERVGCLVLIATTATASAQQIAWSMTGRRAVQLDPGFHGGDYYDCAPGEGPHRGLALARQIGQIHYRSEEVFESRFGRDLLDPLDGAGSFTLDQRFEVEGYLDYHGEKLARRFDANSYLRLNKAMDLHDVGRGRGGPAEALARVSAPALVMSIRSDMLYPPYQQQALRDELRSSGLRVGYYDIESPDGHDGFLLETAQISPIIAAFLDGAQAAGWRDIPAIAPRSKPERSHARRAFTRPVHP